MAHKKAGSAAGTNRDSVSKRLGVKKYAGELVRSGNIIVRQKGNHFYPGAGVRQGNDFTLYSTAAGRVEFFKSQGRNRIRVVS